jgi:hypothetical protein
VKALAGIFYRLISRTDMKHFAALLVLFTCSIYSGSLFAEAIPDSILGLYKKKVPICFFAVDDSGSQVNQCDGFAYDTIAIQRKTQVIAYVGVTLIFQNADRCHFYGVGRWKGHTLEASARSWDSNICRLQIAFDRDGARIVQAGEGCGPAKGYCAYHGTLNGAGPLPKVK